MQGILGYLGYEMSPEAEKTSNNQLNWCLCISFSERGGAGRAINVIFKYFSGLQVVEKLVAAVDVDRSGTVSFAEFLFFMRRVQWVSTF